MSPGSSFRGLIPDLLSDRLATQGSGAHAFSCDRFPAVVLFADVSGFTQLAETFAAQGPDGIEALSRLVNVWFGRMVDVIASHGGDVLRFAGDAPIAAFTPREPERDLGETVARAAGCAADLQRAMRGLGASAGGGRDVVMRIGIGAGDVTAIIAGGVEGRWEFLLAGDPLRQMAEAERAAAPGEIVLSPEARTASRIAVATAAAPDRLRADIDDTVIRPFVSRSVWRFLDAGQSAWTAELRRVTVLFAGLGGLDPAAASDSHRLDSALRRMQAAIFDRGGSVVQFLVDDKGLTLVAAWGLPGHTHEDDAARATRAAVALRAALAADGVSCRIGIATGRVFCGWRGNERRREYALIGAIVNLAARLMTASDGVICDGATRHAAAASGRFEPAGPFVLKGHAEPVPAFRPDDSTSRSRVERDDEAGRRSPGLIGRRTERRLLADAVDALASGRGAAILIRGEPGMGKSTLVGDFLSSAGAAGVSVAAGSGESLSTFEPYFAWRSVLARMLDVDSRAASAARMSTLEARLRGRRGLEEFAPLVADVLGLGAADNEATSQLTEQARVEKTRDLVVQLLNDAAATSRLAIVLDNLHWCDSLSLGLAAAVLRRVSPLLLVLATRPFDTEALPELADLIASPSLRLIDLGRLGRDDVRELMCQRLGVTHVPDALAEVIEEKAGGYPLFVGELVTSLHESGVIETSGSACVLAGDSAGLYTHRFPDSAQGAIADRLDRLGAAEQLTMKVASAVGAQFDVRTLADVHPLSPGPLELDGMLQQLERRGLIRQGAATSGAYEFGHAVIQDVAYSMMLAEQRRGLHRKIAEWYERAPADGTPPALLAHHWTRADDEGNSLKWLERAGIDASRKGAMQETVRCFRQAIEIAGRPGGSPVDAMRRVRWLRYLGHGLEQLGHVPESLGQLRTALDLIGRRLPQSPAGLGATLGREALVQTARLAGLLRSPARLSAEKRDRLLEEAEIVRLLGKMAYFAQDPLTYVTASLRSINLAEKTGAHETASSAYAALGYMVAMFGLEGLARRWWRLADESGDFDARLNRLAGGMLFLNSNVRWEESARLAAAQAELIARVGNSTSMPTHLIITFYLHLHRGEVDEARTYATKLLNWALSQNNAHEAFSGHVHLIMASLEQGRVADADRHIADAAQLAPRAGVPIYSIMYTGLRLDRQRLYGDLDAARADAGTLGQLLARTPPYIGGDMSGYVALTEYFIAQWQRTREPGDGREARRLARQAYGVLGKHAMLNPYARPRRWLLAGKIAAADGKAAGAVRAWRRALALAERYGMPRESAYAHAALGDDIGLSPPDRRAHLASAREVFVKMGCVPRVEGIDRSLAALA